MHARWQHEEGDGEDGDGGDGTNCRVASYVAHRNEYSGGNPCAADCDSGDADQREWVNVRGPSGCIYNGTPANIDERPGVPSIH